MSVVLALHPAVTVRTALRRGLRRHRIRVLACRTASRLEALIATELLEAVIVDVRGGRADIAFALLDRYPRVPIWAYSAFRPDDGRLLAACQRGGLRGILVDGIDDAGAADVIARRSAGSERRALLADAPDRLRLYESMQRQAWHEILHRVGEPLRTGDVAAALGVTREHLSREFQAGGAPNLKRVVDMAKLACAAHLLTNPGYAIADAARVLRFASASHLARCSRRLVGEAPAALPRVGVRGVLDRFVTFGTRSRRRGGAHPSRSAT